MLSEHETGRRIAVREAAVPLADADPRPQARRQRPGGDRFLVEVAILVFLAIAFLYFSRPVALPVILALMAAAALKPVMRLLGHLHVPTIPAALIVFIVMLTALVVAFVEAGRPAMGWINDAPQHVSEFQGRFKRLFPTAARVSAAVTAVSQLSVTDDKKDGQKKVPTFEIKDGRDENSILDWTGTFVAGLGEVLVLVYLLLASGDLFVRKLVGAFQTHRDKERAVEICHDVQRQVSLYLSSVSLINLCLGLLAGIGFAFVGLPHAPMWGLLVAILNFVPYFGPVAGIAIMGMVGLLSFDTLGQACVPFGWYLALHLIEANFVTPILLGRRFTLNPVAIFISLMFWLWLWGIPGALLSVPILVSVKAVCDRVPKANFVSAFISR